MQLTTFNLFQLKRVFNCYQGTATELSCLHPDPYREKGGLVGGLARATPPMAVTDPWWVTYKQTAHLYM